MDRKYNLKLDLQFRCNNSTMKFDEFDKNTSDFFIRVTRGNKLIDISKAIVTLAVIKPDKTADAQFVEIRDNNVYCDLKSSMKDIPGKYEAIASIVMNNEIVITDTITYEVAENKILKQLNTEVVSEEKFTILTDMINRLSVIENSEEARKLAELSREEAEKQREIAKQQLIDQVNKLIADTNSKVDDNLLENSNKVAKLISDTTNIIDDYKLAKDEAIQQDLQLYKQETTENINTYKSDKNIEIDNYKSTKDTEINKNLSDYKTNTTADIETYKNNKNAEINQYKTEKDLEIDTYVANKNKELDRYVADKNNDIDNYKNSKDTLINDKLREVDTAEQSRVEAEQQRVTDHTERETFLNSFESQLGHIVSKNVEQDARIDKVEYNNKVQDVYINGLFNENADGRLTLEGEGNKIKLEGSKEGLVEVGKVVGNTLVNCICKYPNRISSSYTIDSEYIKVNNKGSSHVQEYILNNQGELGLFKPSTKYTIIVNIVKNDLTEGFKVINSYKLEDLDISKEYVDVNVGHTGRFVGVFETKDIIKSSHRLGFIIPSTSTGILEMENKAIILEGDYTNKPIPNEYFEGMQSTFEDKLITQEMVDAGEELAENLGKYKAEVKVVGKNLIPNNLEFITGKKINTTNGGISDSPEDAYSPTFIPIDASKSYVYSNSIGMYGFIMHFYDSNYNWIGYSDPNGAITILPNARYFRCSLYTPHITTADFLSNGQIEEGTQATQYESYKEYKTSILLGSPLLKGDEIVAKEDGLYHWHKMGKYIINGNELGLAISKDYSQLTLTTHCQFQADIIGCKYGSPLICDKFVNIPIWARDVEGINCAFNGNLAISTLKTKLPSDDVEGFKTWLQANPVTIIYELAEPYYEKISDDKFILEIPNNATLHIDSTIPCQSVRVSYTGNVPSVYRLEETGITNTNDIAVTQTAVDFLLMSNMGKVMMISFKNNTKGGNNMGAYFASRIMKKALKYEDVIRKYPEFKEDIDFILRSEGRDDLITV